MITNGVPEMENEAASAPWAVSTTRTAATAAEPSIIAVNRRQRTLPWCARSGSGGGVGAGISEVGLSADIGGSLIASVRRIISKKGRKRKTARERINAAEVPTTERKIQHAIAGEIPATAAKR